MRTVSVVRAVELIPDGASLMIGGFMGVGTPERRLAGRPKRPARQLDDPRQDGARHGRGDDLVSGARRVIVAMQHTAKGAAKLVRRCTLPLTSQRPADLLVTELAVVSFPSGRATLLETAPGVTVREVLAATEAEILVSEPVPEMAF